MNPDKQSAGAEEYYKEAEKTLDDRQTVKLSGRWKKEGPFHESTRSQYIRNKRTTVNYWDMGLYLQFTSLSVYLPAYLVPKDHLRRVSFNTADIEHLGIVYGAVATLSELYSLGPKS